jgi:hypothetical protein
MTRRLGLVRPFAFHLILALQLLGISAAYRREFAYSGWELDNQTAHDVLHR